jgi:DNA-binding protein H-NS
MARVRMRRAGQTPSTRAGKAATTTRASNAAAAATWRGVGRAPRRQLEEERS